MNTNGRNSKVAVKKSQPKKSSASPKPKVSKKKTQNEYIVNVPFTAATQIQQSAREQAVSSFSGTDRIGQVTFGPLSPVGTPIVFKMSPPDLPATRLGNMSRNFQLYRFKKMLLTVFSNLPSTAGGGFTVGYAENPDQSFNSGSQLSSQVFSLPGAVAGNMFVPTKLAAHINDKNKWYRIDEDTEEIMNSTQGMFIISVDSLTAITTPITVPVFLEYVIEFKGSAIQKADTTGAVQIFPSAIVSPVVNQPTRWSVTPIAGEPTSGLVAGKPYLIVPGFLILEEFAEVLVFIAAGSDNFSFYTSEEAFSLGTPIVQSLAGFPPFTTPRTTVQPLN